MSTMKKKKIIDISDFVNVETIQVVTHNLMNRFRLRRKELGLLSEFNHLFSRPIIKDIRRDK